MECSLSLSLPSAPPPLTLTLSLKFKQSKESLSALFLLRFLLLQSPRTSAFPSLHPRVHCVPVFPARCHGLSVWLLPISLCPPITQPLGDSPPPLSSLSVSLRCFQGNSSPSTSSPQMGHRSCLLIFFFLMFIYLFLESGGGAERETERENPNQAPCCQCGAQHGARSHEP